VNPINSPAGIQPALPVLRVAAITAAVLLLASCGGGGGGGDAQASIASGSVANIASSGNSGGSATSGLLVTAPAGADGWTQCAAEGEVCTVPGARQVRYGANGSYTYQNVTADITCNNATFDDPAPGADKSCQYAPAGVTVAGRVYSRAVSGRTLSVGPGRDYARPCDALNVAGDGDVVEIDAAGSRTYDRDVCAFHANDLTIRGINGRPKIGAFGNYAWGKGTWVITGSRVVVDNVELWGAQVPDGNGSAIRLDGKHLTVRNSFIHDNESGILTSNDGESDILIENTEFGHNGNDGGGTHNLYVGHVASLTFRSSYSHDARVGHNLKSRARVNNISYNRFSSTPPGQFETTAPAQPSYEIDLPNAGTAYLIGNVIEQPSANQNSNMVSYGVEGATNPGKSLYVVNNTFINDDSSNGMFILVGSDVTTPLLAQNNIFAGTGSLTSQSNALLQTNHRSLAPAFVNRAAYDLRPAAGAPFIGAGSATGFSTSGVALTPLREYVHIAGSRARNGALDIGAYSAQ
jgi:hypothetical protein